MAYCSMNQVMYLSYLKMRTLYQLEYIKSPILLDGSMSQPVMWSKLISDQKPEFKFGRYGIIIRDHTGIFGIILPLLTGWDDYMGFYGIIFVINSSHRLFMLSILLLATGDLGITIITSYLAIIIITVWPVAAWMEHRSDRRPTGKSHPWQPRSPLGRGRAVRKRSSKECHLLITKMMKILSEQINVGGGVAGYLCGSHSLKDEVKRPERDFN